jgi:hypothetical protein
MHNPQGVTVLMGEEGNSWPGISKGVGSSNGAGWPDASASLAFTLKKKYTSGNSIYYYK